MKYPAAPFNSWLTTLQDSGYRLTGPRRVIVEILAASQRALTPLDIYDLGRVEYPRLGLVTVYRTLEKLEDLGLVQRVHQADGCHMILPAAQGHEHVLICHNCGHAEFFSGDDLGGLIESVASRSGFRIQEHWLQLSGLCEECQKNEPSGEHAG